MTTTGMTELDQFAGTTPTRDHYTRVVRIAGHPVQARVEHNSRLNQSFAITAAASPMTWAQVTEDDQRRSSRSGAK